MGPGAQGYTFREIRRGAAPDHHARAERYAAVTTRDGTSSLLLCGGAVRKPSDRKADEDSVADHTIQKEWKRKRALGNRRKRQDEVVHEEIDGHAVGKPPLHGLLMKGWELEARRVVNRSYHESDEVMKHYAEPGGL